MITERIQALFQFIDFLDKNKETFLKYRKTLEDYYKLKIEAYKLEPINNFKKKSALKELEIELENIYDIISENLIAPIFLKLDELKLNTFHKSGFYFVHLQSEFWKLQESFTDKDVSIIQNALINYIQFRRATDLEDFLNPILFTDLDRTLKIPFDFFYDDENEDYFDKKFNDESLNNKDESGVHKIIHEPIKGNETVEKNEKESDITSKIKLHFDFFRGDCPRKHKQIINDTDYQKLISWTTYYYLNSFKVPEINNPIKTINTNKTYIQLAFKYLFKELHPSMTYPESLFRFYSNAFFPYRNDKRQNFESVRNNDEVKRLMKMK